MTIQILTLGIKSELDVVGARQRARQIAGFCGFGTQDQVRIATSVSELARNIYNYAISGTVRFMIEGETAPQVLEILIEDKGPGISNLDFILSGNYKSPTGMGKGLLGARRLMDRFEIITNAETGTRIKLQKLFVKDAPLITPQHSNTLLTQLGSLPANIAMSEVLQQNQELLGAMAELKIRQDELLQLTRELEDTNRGVVALYAELDEKADHLRRADDMKSRFLSNMSHEFRTPLSSIRALSRLLIDRIDGELSLEQEKQVLFIAQAATDLSDLVNDLLDLAKIEAGKLDIRAHHFLVSNTFSSLRGMLRPLLVSESLTLTFVEPELAIEMFTDEAKLSQILRNFISNALKFTEAGEITVSATLLPEQNLVKFSVADTGIGIATADLNLIFEEYSQLENRLQGKIKGTGLGLPLCRNLAQLLKGNVAVESTPGVGSIFSVTLPRHITHVENESANLQANQILDDKRVPILIVEDQAPVRLLYKKFLMNTEFRVVMAQSVNEAIDLWLTTKPAAIILDILLNGEDAWSWLTQLKSDPLYSAVPVIIATEIEDKRKGLALGAEAYFVKPLFRQPLLATLRLLISRSYSELNQAIA
jgi:signal transduction histidine kinase/ActR/RegA family two-component response regulator